MKKIFALLLITIVPLIFIINSQYNITAKNEEFGEEENESIEFRKEEHESEEYEKEKGEYKKDDSPYAKMTMQEKLRIWDAIGDMPPDIAPLNQWTSVGPAGMFTDLANNIKFSGRIKWVKQRGNKIFASAETGGLWRLITVGSATTYECITENLRTKGFHRFDIKPGDENTIVLSTETGVYKTRNGGINWYRLNSVPDGTIEIMYDPIVPNKIHFAGSYGYKNSLDSGATISNSFSIGNLYFTNVAINSSNSNLLCISIWRNDAFTTPSVLYSTDGGQSFNNAGGLPTSQVYNANVVYSVGGTCYAQIERPGLVLEIYKSFNNGQFWNLAATNLGNGGAQGIFQFLAASPYDPNVCFGGAVMMWRTTNGGTFSFIGHNALHPDIHCVTWTDDGRILCGGDGGLQVSSDNGTTWNTNLNSLPITQYYHFDVSSGNPNYLVGGSQDNGLSVTSGSGNFWFLTGWGDGDGICYDPGQYNIIYGIIGYSFRHVKSTNYGQTWFGAWGEGTPDAIEYIPNQFGGQIISDGFSPTWLYTAYGPYIYKSTNQSQTWKKLSRTPFYTQELKNYYNEMSVQGSSAYLYITRKGVNYGSRLYRINTGANDTALINYEGNLPNNVEIRKIVPSKYYSTTLYAMLWDYANLGYSVMKSTNNGASWFNRTNNLPQVFPNDLVEYPNDSSKLVIATEFGCYKTTNGGSVWQRWNKSMPEGVKTVQLKGIDSTAIPASGKFYVYACTYGRGIFYRDFTDFDPPTNISNTNEIKGYRLNQNYPNPFNPETSITFSVPKKENVEIKIYSITGQEIMTLTNKIYERGDYRVTMNGTNLSSGVYFYKLVTSSFSDTKRMMLIK